MLVVEGDHPLPVTVRCMPIYALGDLVPSIHPDAFVHPDAIVIGAVEIGSESSVWPGAVLRGDASRIVVGTRTSVQDGAIVAANAVVLDDTDVPAGALALGVPAKIREGAANPDLIDDGIQTYTEQTVRYRAELRRIG